MDPSCLRSMNLNITWAWIDTTIPGMMRLNHFSFPIQSSNVTHLPYEMVEIFLEVVVDKLEE